MQQITVIEHLLLHQKESPMATGRFTRLLNELILAAKIISREVNKAGLVDVLGFTGTINVQGEEVLKLDEFANRVLIHRLERAGVLCAMASEENADLIEIPSAFPFGDYILIFDPLDGSSNIDSNVSIGTIFSHLSPPKSGREKCDLGGGLAERGESGGRRIFRLRLIHHDGVYHRPGGAWFHSGPQRGRVLAFPPRHQDPGKWKILFRQ